MPSVIIDNASRDGVSLVQVELDEFIDPYFQIGLALEWYEKASFEFDKFDKDTVESNIHALYLDVLPNTYSLGEDTADRIAGFFLRVVKPNIINGKVTNLTLDQIKNFRENLAI